MSALMIHRFIIRMHVNVVYQAMCILAKEHLEDTFANQRIKTRKLERLHHLQYHIYYAICITIYAMFTNPAVRSQQNQQDLDKI